MKDYNYYMKNYHQYKRFNITIKFTYNDNLEDTAHHSRMYKTKDEIPDWNEFAHEYLSRRKEDKKYESIDLVEVIPTQMPDDEWILVWFDHMTFDDGRSDEEAIASFEAFLRRSNGYVHNGEIKGVDGRYVSMGADERWRWHGKVYSDNFDPENADFSLIDKGDAPCRCKYCKELGLIKICH
ncbi:MAG: hypothetical protein KAS32_21740 [Candidatus Peribacteraceae bacterium]|nr:hypothetical protein [Candidatus Peribacteraceae bacterium]